MPLLGGEFILIVSVFCAYAYFFLNMHVLGGDDDQFEEEKELIINEIEKVSQLPNLDS